MGTSPASGECSIARSSAGHRSRSAPCPEDFIRWFAEGWAPGRGDVHVVELDGQIVAVSLAFLRPLQLAGGMVMARQGAYAAVDPEMRRRRPRPRR